MTRVLLVAVLLGMIVGAVMSGALDVVGQETTVLTGEALYLGDNIVAGIPMLEGFIGHADRAIVFHVSDAILSLEELQYEGTVDVENGERIELVFLGIGTHALQGSDKPYPGHPDLFRRRYARLLGTALAYGDRVIAVGIPWLNWVPEKIDRGVKWNQIMREEARLRGVCFVEVWDVMYDCGLACISDDGYHPNALGYELLGNAVRECE